VRRVALPSLAAMLLAACQPGSAGPLDPVAAPGVERQDDERWHHAAVVSDGPLTARIVGRWSTRGGQTLRVSYRNAGAAPVSIRVSDFKLVHAADEAALQTAVDATGVDMTDAREDNNRPRVLFSLEGDRRGAATVSIAPGTTRVIEAELTSLADADALAEDGEVVATIPMAGGARSVTFRLAGPPGHPF